MRFFVRTALVVAGLVAMITTATGRPSGAATPRAGDAGIVEVTRLGSSVQGRAILAYRLGDPLATRKVVLLGQMHGDEHAGVLVAQSLLAGAPLAGVDLWVIPTMNPDGDAAHTRLNAHGVDLNRNWPDSWTPVTGNFNPGPAALSEPETRAMFGFLTRVRPDYLISIHQPLGGVDTTDGGARDPGLAARLATNLGLPLKAFRCWSVCHGSMTGWLTDQQPGVAETIEFPAAVSADYLQTSVPWQILAAVGGIRYATANDRQPRVAITASSVLPATGGQPAGTGHTGSLVQIAGTAWDPDLRSGSVGVTVSEGHSTAASTRTVHPSAPLNRRYRLTGSHGYLVRFLAPPGRHRYCVVVRNVGTATPTPVSRCLIVTVDGRPYGALDQASVGTNVVTVSGWEVDPNRSAQPGQVSVLIDSVPVALTPTDAIRPDVNAVYRLTGTHGFAVQVPLPSPGWHAVCVSARPAVSGAEMTVGCQQIQVT